MQDMHTVEVPDGSAPAWQDRVIIAMIPGVVNAAGGGAGAAVTTAVSGLVNLPANYGVFINPGQDATWFIPSGSKTATGFNVTLTPRLAANTLAAGTFDVIVVA